MSFRYPSASRSPRRSARSRSRSFDRYQSYRNGYELRRRSRSRSYDRYGSSGGGGGGGYSDEDVCRLHIGDLNDRCTQYDLEKAFSKFGELREVWMARNPPSFAFVVFKDPRDAAIALKELDGRTVGYCRIRVSWAKPRTRGRNRWDPEMRCFQCGEKGHFARDCQINPNGSSAGLSGGYRSRESGRRYERSYSRERDRQRGPSPIYVSHSRQSRSRSPRREYSNGYY